MINAISHRGPDGQGFHCDDEISLGHARLSIIDLATGAQPMANESGTVVISFNGEIFNYLELRDDLINRGYRFRTRSDTEVIIHLYEEFGTDCLEKLNGDFAFALWDGRAHRLMLARDRMGVRPLYYTVHKGTLFFASEIKALLEVPGLEVRPDPFALDQIFTFWFPLAPRTPFKGICELPPAHLLLASAEGMQARPYWQLSFPSADDHARRSDESEDAVAEELRSLFFDATRIRLRSDVPVGAYLSGGLDSSIVTAAAKNIASHGLKTFSLAFQEAEFDESEFQRRAADELQTEHRSIVCTSSDIGNVFPRVIQATETPIVRTAPAPMLLLSKLVRRSGLKVVLTGEGADELFAGYDIFKEAKVRRFCARSASASRRRLLFRRLYPYLPRMQTQSQAYLNAFFMGDARGVDDPLFSHMPRFRTTAGAKAFFSQEMRESLADYDAVADLRDRLPTEFARWHPLSQAQYLESAYLLPSYILSSQGDRVAMANAVEARFPFLDHRLVEFAARLNPRTKLRTLREKHILREAMRGILPASVYERTKQPYRAVESQAFVQPGAPAYVQSQLDNETVIDAGYFEPTAIDKLVAKCRSQRSVGARDEMAFVGILSTQVWHSEFVAKRPSRPSLLPQSHHHAMM